MGAKTRWKEETMTCMRKDNIEWVPLRKLTKRNLGGT